MKECKLDRQKIETGEKLFDETLLILRLAINWKQGRISHSLSLPGSEVAVTVIGSCDLQSAWEARTVVKVMAAVLPADLNRF